MTRFVTVQTPHVNSILNFGCQLIKVVAVLSNEDLCLINHLNFLDLTKPHSTASNKDCQNSKVYLSKRRIKMKIPAMKINKTPNESAFK